jgi:predicted RNA methylase
VKIPPEVLEVLTDPRTVIAGDRVHIPFELGKPLYERLKRIFGEMGGKWDGRKAVRAHVFPRGIESFMFDAITAGEFPSRFDTGWYATPPAVVEELLAHAGISEKYPGKTTLEPSAGIGSIAGPAAARGAVVDVVELDEHRASVLAGHGLYRRVVHGDFLEVDPLSYEVGFQRVVMNPPFAEGLRHVNHALGFLGDDGVLVSVLSEGVTWHTDRATVEFRRIVDEAGGAIVRLPDGSFRASGTDIKSVLVVVPTMPGHTVRNHSWHLRRPKQLDLFAA